ncbi:MAG: Phenylpropionate dioxygenase, large terminal subunit [Hydrocarboniphaga sp.]|uniref:aromatic ring-hydroxylating oxygenase subunit alpha n=1 Tax=Hydrocarboniphaga sp. TaxID=2033016 RepID=UPI0026016C20|nr:aromatic ring-hydroxylating dioxygenase subunit alpha [Hydrocarboniphaga sp.]MDB5971572.1 Phenylpropionate dioxygenase, large terminal subunit [Hydrocarboniphaga sp.]
MSDPLLVDDWHPVAASASLLAGQTLAAQLLGEELVLWRDSRGACHAWQDRCPHRGTRLTLGHVADDALVCRYHAWKFGVSGACLQVPAQPDAPLPGGGARVFSAFEIYGLIWVCIGTPPPAPPPFPEYANPKLRKVVCGAYPLHAAGPRIIENFLDMAHFGTVHDGILGTAEHMEVCDYQVQAFDDGDGNSGVLATQCMALQPQPNSVAQTGSQVEYTYRVVRPLTAMLTKLPQAQQGFIEAIAIIVQPLGEELSAVWIVLTVSNADQSDDELRAFQDRIFHQDISILENQLPKRLPLYSRAEISVACDRSSLAYRAYLRGIGLRYGVINEA